MHGISFKTKWKTKKFNTEACLAQNVPNYYLYHVLESLHRPAKHPVCITCFCF